MKKSHLAICASVVVLCAGVYFALSVRSATPKLAQAQCGQRAEDVASGADAIGELQAEVRRLQAEATEKDNLIRLIAVHARAPDTVQDSAPAPAPRPNLDRVAQVCGILDERIRASHADLASAQVLKQALQQLIDSGTLGQTKVTSLLCSSSMCKVGLNGESALAVSGSAEAMAEHAPKMFGATAMYRTESGETAMYLARSQDDLAIDPDTELTD